ncbi:type II toxin-antitoxin system RelE/ParE family toxin [Sphingomonas sp. 1P08PE]|uniref:type II toxin-antitoxin system RelE/ParE family toxin n=1 Tax=Sphingomonas sp. 1P08PE TaxID=554122 RepID=UPI0039A16DC4
MRYGVKLTPAALQDAREIAAYIAEHRGRDEAEDFFTSLLDCVDSLASFPDRGSRPRELMDAGQCGFRQTLLGRYRIVYSVLPGAVSIPLIADGRRDMQALLHARIVSPHATT